MPISLVFSYSVDFWRYPLTNILLFFFKAYAEFDILDTSLNEDQQETLSLKLFLISHNQF